MYIQNWTPEVARWLPCRTLGTDREQRVDWMKKIA
jgi:hypothetical protein